MSVESVPWWEWREGKRPGNWTEADERDWRREEPPAPEPQPQPELEVVTAEDFAAVDEPGAEALVGDEDGVLIPEDGDVMFYGDGGAGKTTLAIDLACHLAAGDDWLGIPIGQTARVLLIENEGPRAPFRAKLRRKLAAWTGSPLEGRLTVLESPWARLSFDEFAGREALACAIRESEADVVVVGPVTASGMNAAGTLQEVRSFARLVGHARELSERRVAFVLIHHENKGGQVSGAWEAAGDTLFHVQGQGHGRTRLFVQKARWSSEHHATALNLLWAEGDGFAVEEQPEEFDDDALAELILAFVRENAGTGWKKVEQAISGRNDNLRQVREGLLAGGWLVNVVKGVDGQDATLNRLEHRKPARLYVADDPVVQHLARARGPAGGQLPFMPDTVLR
jgi:hypothetical protein